MNVLRQVASELYSMFAADAVMSAGAVIIVALAAALRFLTMIPSPLIGAGLVIGCLLLLLARVFAHAGSARIS